MEQKKINGLVNRGCWRALRQVMERAEKKEALTIGFLGGSITQGSLSSTPQSCYAYLVYDWWCRTFPEARFSYVNGGIGGTSSHFGAARAWEDVLRYRPDVVVVDFSVNDEGEEAFFEETFEGLIRQLLSAPSHPAVMIMNNVFYDDGRNAQEYHNRIGAYYGIPCISMKEAIYRQYIETGILQRAEITPDNLHPNDKGHRMVADVICGFLEAVRKEGNTASEKQQTICASADDRIQLSAAGDNPLLKAEPPADRRGAQMKAPSERAPRGKYAGGVLEKQPLTANAYEKSCRLQITSDAAVLDGFRADPSDKKGMLDIFKNGWTAEQTDDKIIFELECSCFAVQYRKSVQQPVPVAEAIIDGDEAHAVVLDGNFEETWGDCLYLQPLLHHAQHKVHRVEIRIVEAQEIVRPFYLVSVIAS